MNMSLRQNRGGKSPIIRLIPLTVAMAGVMAILCVGCASTKPYARFAQAGTTYASAVDRLLETAGNVAIDATSERLLQDDVIKNQDVDSYSRLSNIDRERLAVIGRLRGHTRLLARYFVLLNELSTSEKPESVQQAFGRVVEDLNALGKQLRESELAPNEDAFTSLTELMVGFAIRGSLKEELNKRKDAIQLELKTQEELLKALTDAIQHDLTIINQAQEQRIVIEPLIADTPIGSPDAWIADRRMILISQASVEELANASDAARELRETFEDLVTGKLNLQRLNTLLADLESILAVAEAIDQGQKGEQP
jgi:hypothetical protein